MTVASGIQDHDLKMCVSRGKTHKLVDEKGAVYSTKMVNQ